MVEMIELKLSQGAKPAHGGILPEAKISDEISQHAYEAYQKIKIVCLPPHTMRFSTPIEMMHFIQKASPPFRRKTSGL